MGDKAIWKHTDKLPDLGISYPSDPLKDITLGIREEKLPPDVGKLPPGVGRLRPGVLRAEVDPDVFASVSDTLSGVASVDGTSGVSGGCTMSTVASTTTPGATFGGITSGITSTPGTIRIEPGTKIIYGGKDITHIFSDAADGGLDALRKVWAKIPFAGEGELTPEALRKMPAKIAKAVGDAVLDMIDDIVAESPGSISSETLEALETLRERIRKEITER